MRRTILLADDSVTVRKIVELTYGDTDIHVESVASGYEALEKLPVLKPDLVLADVVMPGPSGYDVCRAVKDSDRPVPVLLLAGTFEPFDADRARACGSDGHVTKPFDARLLIERVQRLLNVPAEPAFSGGPAAPSREDEFEAMFDDLASSHDPGQIDTAAVAASPTDDPPDAPQPASPSLSAADLDAIVRAVVARLSDHVVREIAWDVVPDLADVIVRERIRELERDDGTPS